MKLLLCKNVSKLGIVGDIVNVANGYGRNYLLPCGLATQPTETNVRALAEARKQAEVERVRERELIEALAKSMEDVEVTIRAKANEDGVLYGSVGAKEISAALIEEGHAIQPDQVVISSPIRHLDNLTVDLKLADDLKIPAKVWIVREKSDDDDDDEDGEGTEGDGPVAEAAGDDDNARE